MNSILLAFVSTNGELGTIANLEMHNMRKNGNLTGHDEYLKEIIKSDLPQKTMVSKKYSGATRIVVVTNQSVLQKGEDFYLRIRVLWESDNISGKIFYMKLGDKNYSAEDLKLICSHVFEVKLTSVKIPDDFEYYLQVSDGKRKALYPATAGSINSSVICL